jgi:DNA-binding NtrC family response regulator
MKEHFDELVEYLLEKEFFLEQAVEVLESTLIGKALRRAEGNQCAASKMLGIHRNTLKRKMEEYHLQGRRAPRKPMARANGKPTSGRKVS